jgi:hypothetical protein
MNLILIEEIVVYSYLVLHFGWDCVVFEPDMWTVLWPFIVPQSRLPVRADWVNA